ncbi:MAG: 4'-phosphopantetheinyl transferase superfamily protein [Thermoanaerobaculales bacterium]|nr:4'-phosphopantetheinyl transferase superfamily protein [Thermoanaerobaculales bacterium]
MVGNDVVDLGDRETQPESRHPRFDRRVFTADEYRLIEAGPNSNELRWTLWACKESAYKLFKRQNPTTVFSPRAFEVTMALAARSSHRVSSRDRKDGAQRGFLSDEATSRTRRYIAEDESRKDPHGVPYLRSQQTAAGEKTGLGPTQVHHQGYTAYVQVTVHGDAIHAVATRSSDDIPRLISAIGTTESNPSAAVRELARQHLARVLTCTPDDIEIVSACDRIPELRIGGSRAQGFISLSHHGRFVGFSATLRRFQGVWPSREFTPAALP